MELLLLLAVVMLTNSEFYFSCSAPHVLHQTLGTASEVQNIGGITICKVLYFKN